jgi:hypothetical protein
VSRYWIQCLVKSIGWRDLSQVRIELFPASDNFLIRPRLADVRVNLNERFSTILEAACGKLDAEPLEHRRQLILAFLRAGELPD